MSADTEHNRFSNQYINLAHDRLGAKAVFATDEFFAPCERMLKAEPAVFIPGKFDKHGKWMDGWESRRKRVAGYDYCIVRLAGAGRIHGVDIDTSHFCGNQPVSASIDACLGEGDLPADDTQWTTILDGVDLEQNAHHLHDIGDAGIYSHVRLNIYPDGGVARLRVYGELHIDRSHQESAEPIDLAALLNGGKAVACSDQSFGSSMHSLGLPGRGIDMGDGWETARRRTPGNEWVIIELGHPAMIEAVEIDTAHYKGNFPDRISIQAGNPAASTTDALITQSMFWPELLSEQPLTMDAIHRFENELKPGGLVSHVRVNVHPDGGLSRVRLYGTIGDR